MSSPSQQCNMKTTIGLVLTLGTLVATTEFQMNRPDPKIVGGQEAIPHSMPYLALLTVRGVVNNQQAIWTCSGSVISKNYVLTSGRCVSGGSQVRVTLGAHNASQLETTQVHFNTIGIKIHPEYREGFSMKKVANDIALLKIEFEIPYNNYIQPIALPSSDDILDSNTFVGYTARTGGWGLTKGTENNSSANLLNYLDAKVIRNTECKQTYFSDIDNKVICTTGSANVGICSGDVGAPLVADFKQVGISSFWAILCITGYPSGYTRVSSYMDWIVANSDYVMT